MEKFVITISRRCGSGAITVGRILADNLGIHMYDREILRLASDDSGINEAYFQKADGEVKRSLLYRVSRNVYKGELIPPEDDNFLSNENLFNYQAKVLNELSANESFVVIGRAADYVLRGRPNIFSVFLYAPDEVCIQHEIQTMNLTYDEAVRHIKKRNRFRRGYCAHHTGRTWEDMRNYDLCLNTAALGYEKTARLIEEYVRLKMGEG